MTDEQRITDILIAYTKKHKIMASSVILEDYAEELVANGVVVPPCKVGDSIFRVGNGEIWEWLIEHIEIYDDEMGFVDDGENYFTPDKIGKTVFLTKEDAEAKLKELNG